MILANFIPLIPEGILSLGSFILLLWGVFHGKRNVDTIIHAACLFILIALAVSVSQLTNMDAQPTILFNGQYAHDVFSVSLKSCILVMIIMVLLMTRTSMHYEQISRFEYPILIVLATLGMMIMVSAKGFLTLFMGLELQSLSLYILCSIKRDCLRASESGMKYFLLGALSTGIILYGISLVYGSTGSFSFTEIHAVVQAASDAKEILPLGLTIGFFFILAGMIFKVSVVPFHMWTPDVYEGAPLSVTTLLATVPKIAAFAMIVRLLVDPFGAFGEEWSTPVMYLSIASMILGSFAILAQKNIRRFLAYSSIANAGYALMGMMVVRSSGVESTMLYAILYALTVFGLFCCLTILTRRGKKVENISDLAGIGRIYPGVTFIMCVFLFSMAGFPTPLAGFFAKLYVFNRALNADLIVYSIIAILASLVLAAYYIWIIKVITMDEPNRENWAPLTNIEEDKVPVLLMILIFEFLFIFFLKPTFFVKYLSNAAESLFLK